jgi:hypothetical protein
VYGKGEKGKALLLPKQLYRPLYLQLRSCLIDLHTNNGVSMPLHMFTYGVTGRA